MSAIYSRLTAKSQTTIPTAVRKALALTPGDAIAYEIDGGRVSLSKVARGDDAYLRALQGTLGEWDSPEDAAAFDDL